MKSLALVAALALVPAAALALPCSEENAKFPPERQAEIALLMAAN
ncbi:MAG: hypothetical protein AAF416_21115 [Pseudomonadota bacterium]